MKGLVEPPLAVSLVARHLLQRLLVYTSIVHQTKPWSWHMIVTDWQARHGITAAEYQTAITRLSGQGFRPVDLSIFRSGRQVLFSAIWEQEQGLQWIARHGLTGAEYQTLFNDLSRGGFRLRCVSPYEDAGGERFACIWERYAGPAWAAQHGLTAEAYQREFDAQNSRGFRLVRAVGYTIGGQNRYAGIWEQSPGH